MPTHHKGSIERESRPFYDQPDEPANVYQLPVIQPKETVFISPSSQEYTDSFFPIKM